jgi:hypothetical protein
VKEIDTQPLKGTEVDIDVYDIVPGISIDYKQWAQSERDVITPALVSAGYSVGNWFTAEGDSFGPLCRAARATSPDGELVTVFYG